MNKLLLIGLGGFAGAILRYLVSGWVQGWVNRANFPYGTLVVNVCGCLVMGLLAGLAERSLVSEEMRALVMVGVLGAFTTFSTFGNDTLLLWRAGANVGAWANVGAHIFLGLGAVWAGRALATLSGR